jgi:putative colanic acid biosynthesis acetyltransferase WcaF
MPWNLIMKKNSCLGKNVDCYNYDKIFIFQNSIISQNSFLCTASHRYDSKNFELIIAPITIKEKVWVAANCFVAPGIMMEKESVLLANSNLTKNTKKNSVYAGNPAKFKKKRY